MKQGDPLAESKQAVRALIDAAFEALELPASEQATSQLTDLALLLSHWAQRINLTGHRGPVEMTQRLILDAVSLAAAIPELARAERMADLGSGAGFPGLPIAVLNPELHVYLVDARMKRNHFQREARRRLGLERVHPLLGRSDELDPVECDIVVAQAMTQPEQALSLMQPWGSEGSLIILPASESAEAPSLPPGLASLERREYRVPGIEASRQLWVARKRSSGVSPD